MENTLAITLEGMVQRKKKDILSSEIGDDLVIMNIEAGNYVTLNKMGRIVWEQIENPVKIKVLLNYLTGRFGVGEDKCENDTLEYLNAMNEQNLIIIS